MKSMIIAFFVLTSAFAAQAKTVNSDANLSVQAASIDQTIRLFERRKPGNSHEKVSIVVTDHGMSTDVSPRYKVYLTYISYAEMGNISTAFEISDDVFHFTSAKRTGRGIYEVKAIVYDERGMVEVTKTIDATKMFADEDKLRKTCGSGFCDENLNTSIEVKETWKDAKW